jgi:hypothetical protein
MSGGFRVDLTALTQAAEGITGTLDALDAYQVSDIDGDKGVIGHDHLAEALSDFCGRWQLGVQNLAKDAEAIAGQLTESVVAYQKVEQANHRQFTGILENSTGPDPAAH